MCVTYLGPFLKRHYLWFIGLCRRCSYRFLHQLPAGNKETDALCLSEDVEVEVKGEVLEVRAHQK